MEPSNQKSRGLSSSSSGGSSDGLQGHGVSSPTDPISRFFKRIAIPHDEIVPDVPDGLSVSFEQACRELWTPLVKEAADQTLGAAGEAEVLRWPRESLFRKGSSYSDVHVFRDPEDPKRFVLPVLKDLNATELSEVSPGRGEILFSETGEPPCWVIREFNAEGEDGGGLRAGRDLMAERRRLYS